MVTGICNRCDADGHNPYQDLRRVELEDRSWGYQCSRCGSTFTVHGKPAESRSAP